MGARGHLGRGWGMGWGRVAVTLMLLLQLGLSMVDPANGQRRTPYRRQVSAAARVLCVSAFGFHGISKTVTNSY